MVIKREGHRFIVLEPALTWIKEGKCAGCGKPSNEWKRRKDWKCCSIECTEKYLKTSVYLSWGDLRTKAIERDNFRCVKCGSKGYSIEHKFKTWCDNNFHEKIRDGTYTILEENEVQYTYKKQVVYGFVVDHIKPIALGGAEWDINNLQTLCPACNKIKTREDAANIAEARRIEKKLVNGQKQLADMQAFSNKAR